MRTLVLATSLTFLVSACSDELGAPKEPPLLRVTSPDRSLMRDHAGTITVAGTVAPSSQGVAVQKVVVNGVAAKLEADGSFTATIDLRPGATLLNTVATGKDGGKAEDTRSVEAGPLMPAGTNVQDALTTAISKTAFAKIASAASTILKTTDFKPMLPAFNPMMHSGDESGPDCLYGQLYVDDFKMTNATITMVPVNGGLSFSAKLDGVDVPGRMNYAVACISGNDTVRVTATSALVSGTLMVTPDGMNGFKTDLLNPVVQLTGLNITASGVPGAIMDIIPLDSLIQKVAPLAAKMFMGPMVNKALGGLAGPKEMAVLGKTIVLQVNASAISFDTNGGLVTLDTMMLIKGTENSKGFVFTDNGMPSMDPGNGLLIGIADDLANSMMSQLAATRMLNLKMAAQSGTFDGTELAPTSPPMISADPSTGMMRLILPDMMATFTFQGTPVGKAAINATVDLKITPSATGYGVSVELGTPVIHATVLDEIPNQTLLSDADLGKAVEIGLTSQISTISTLLGAIPLPALPGGLTLKDMSIGSDDGYVVLKGTLE